VSERQLRDEVITLYLAGHDATSHTITWVLHFLALHPDLQQRLRKEAADLLSGSAPTYGQLRSLSYTQMVVQEAMRIRPAAALLVREVVSDDSIGGYPLKGGTWILVSSYLTHNMGEFWPEPNIFRPERFSEEESMGRHPFAYYPFGVGPRTCIGNHLAFAEVQLILAMILQRYEFVQPAGATVTPTWRGTLHPKGGLRLIRRRIAER
jgi:cytochrome P450